MPSKQTKRVKGSVGEGESDKQVKTIKHLGGQGTASLTTITSVVKQTEGDKYVTRSLVLSFIHTCMKRLAKTVRLSINQDLEDRWVTNLNEDRKRFFRIVEMRGSRVTVFLQWNLKVFTVGYRILR
jgi:hypothetical protein